MCLSGKQPEEPKAVVASAAAVVEVVVETTKVTAAVNNHDGLEDNIHLRGKEVALDLIPVGFLFYVLSSLLARGLAHYKDNVEGTFILLTAFVLSFTVAAIVKQQIQLSIYRNMVRVITVSLFVWLQSLQQLDEQSSSLFADGNSPVCCAFSIGLGFLAFEQFATRLFWRPSSSYFPTKSAIQVLEDAATITGILVCYVQFLQRNHHPSEPITSTPAWLLLDEFKLYSTIYAYTVYKVVRLALRLDNPSPNNPTESYQLLTTEQTGGVQKEYVWNLYGHTYDMSDFVDKHPGGKEAILLGANREDATPLFMSYHAFNVKQAHQVLAKYRVYNNYNNNNNNNDDNNNCNNDVDTKKNKTTVIASRHENDLFYDEMCKRVANVLKENGVDPIQDRVATNVRALWYVIVLVSTLVFGYAHVKGNYVGSFLFGIFGWLLGGLGHDGNHYSVSRKPWINDLSSWGISLICNPIMWPHQHTYGHHSYTNDFDHDPDLHHSLRFHPKKKYEREFQQQARALFVLATGVFVALGTCFLIPLGMFTEGSLYRIVEWTDRKRPLRALAMFVHLVTYFGIVMILPFFYHETWYSGLAGVFLHLATVGQLFAVFSRINHLNERSIQYEKRRDDDDDDAKHLKKKHPDAVNSWAATQVETSTNFCTDSLFWHIASSGLNHQIEHHLYPGLNHCHLHLIQPTIQQMCEEYGVEYKSYNSWWEAMKLTLDWLKVLSVEEYMTVH